MTAPVSRIGEYIREQRTSAKISLRRLAEDAGVSNPYLSQIERGLRKPSAEILQQIAKGLRVSAEQLYVQAGLLEDKGASLAVEAAILSDPSITERQKRVLLDIYASFLGENEAAPQPAKQTWAQATAGSTSASESATPAKKRAPARKRTTTKKSAAPQSGSKKSTTPKTTTKKRTNRSSSTPTPK